MTDARKPTDDGLLKDEKKKDVQNVSISQSMIGQKKQDVHNNGIALKDNDFSFILVVTFALGVVFGVVITLAIVFSLKDDIGNIAPAPVHNLPATVRRRLSLPACTTVDLGGHTVTGAEGGPGTQCECTESIYRSRPDPTFVGEKFVGWTCVSNKSYTDQPADHPALVHEHCPSLIYGIMRSTDFRNPSKKCFCDGTIYDYTIGDTVQGQKIEERGAGGIDRPRVLSYTCGWETGYEDLKWTKYTAGEQKTITY